MTTVLVSGAVANKYRHGGSLWVRMSWAEGLQRLGFEVIFVEELHAGGDPATFAAVMEELGLRGALLVGEDVVGMSRSELLEHAEQAALLVNLSGHLRRSELLRRVRRRVFIDLDPGYTQIWHAEGRDIGLAGHHLYFTVGSNIGTAYCPVPTDTITWLPIRQPVVLDRWPMVDARFTRFTTVASWRGAYGPVSWAGHSYGVKAHEFRRYADLPRACELPFEIALDLEPADRADRERLLSAGWTLTEPRAVASPAAFARFVRGSGAEFSVAQGVYVDTGSGWFSDRTVRYLASGRPALVQDTGFSRTLPVGDGLLSFRTPKEAAARASEIVLGHRRHCRAARRLAEDFFASDRALAPLLEAAEVAP